jgi:undecaprenyl diphosphate synthase
MPAEIKKEIQLEIAHVLFIDIVGYSKLSVNEQHRAVELAAGELAHRVEVSGPAEVAALGDAFNRMADSLEEAEELTKNNTGTTLVVAFNYGSRQEVAGLRDWQ